MTMMQIAIGSRWKERDPRVDRVVRVVSYDESWVKICNLKGTRLTRVESDSFMKRFQPVTTFQEEP